MTGPEAALAACRFAQACAAMLLWGGLGYLGTCVPPSTADAVASRLRLAWPPAVVLTVAATFATLPVMTAGIGSGWPDALSRPVLRAVLFETGAGRAWRIEAASALLLLVCTLVPSRGRRGAVALAAGLVLVSLAITGHAATRVGWPGVVQRANAAIHVLAAGAWLGALVTLLPMLARLDGPPARETAVALRRFSTIGHWVVALVLATGALNTALVLGRWPTDLASPYQALLLAKVALVAAMVGLAVLNRYRFVPRLAMDRAGSLAALRRATRFEVALGLGALALVSVFGLLDPG